MIGPNSEQIGVISINRAMEMAREHNLDLVEVAPTAKPPVCRIIDFSKYKYDQQKKERRDKRRQHISHLKQIRVKPHIDENDYQVKLRQAITFLEKKDKVKVNLFFRGREMSYKALGSRIIDRFVKDLDEHSLVEKAPLMEGRVLSVVFGPKSEKTQVKEEQNAKT